MNPTTLKKQAHLAGFSKILGAPESNFILFSKDTDGRSGRRVYIDSQLSAQFAAEVPIQDDNLVMNQLKQLTALAGGLNAYTNFQDASEHFHIVGDLKISYKILQISSNGKLPGVYITDIGYADFGQKNKPGIYKVVNERNKWLLDETILNSITTTNAAINGLCENKKQASIKILPDMIENAYGNKAGINAIRNEGYSLFFNPQTQMSDGKSWRSPEQKSFNKHYTANLLAKSIKQSQLTGNKVQWTIHGNGAALFGKAIKQLQGTTLDKHEVIFLAPSNEAIIPDILKDMRNTKMALHKDVMKTNENDWSSIKNNTVLRTEAIANQVHQFGSEHHDIAATLRAKGRSKSMQLANTLKAIGTLGVSEIFKIKDYRDITASNLQITDPAINPHFHPYKDKATFNQHANNASNGQVNSIVFTELVKHIRKILPGAKG